MINLNKINIVLLLVISLFLISCGSKKAGVKAPELPVKHWLDDAPGVPVENKDKLAAAVPNLYDPKKLFNFEECVFLAIQQSPLLVNSAVELEIKRLAFTDAAWKYLPDLRLSLGISNNITYFNNDVRDTPGDYGRPKFAIGFYAPFPNPMRTYFEQQVQKVMVNMALATHRKAIGETINNIGEAYLRLQAQREILATQKTLLPVNKELIAYWQQVESVEGKQGASLSLAIEHQRELELMVEKTRMQEVMRRTQLKILAGVEPSQRFEIDTKSAASVLGNFNGKSQNWEERWVATEDELLLRAQLKLSDYNIMVAWAQYLPDMTIQINKYPPAGQYQPPDGQEDFFVHLTFDFPLIDWGHRYRGVQTARMKKAQAFHEISRKRTDYSHKWLQAEQRVSLASTQLKLANVRLGTAEMQYKEAKIAFDAGTEQLPLVATKQEAMVQAKIAKIEAEMEYKLANLEWMYLANLLQERFLGLPAKEIL